MSYDKNLHVGKTCKRREKKSCFCEGSPFFLLPTFESLIAEKSGVKETIDAYGACNSYFDMFVAYVRQWSKAGKEMDKSEF